MSLIESTIRGEISAGRRALIPYLTAGFPDLAATPDILLALADNGADVIELGVPFSDPIADGPTIQKACSRALDAGTTTHAVLDLVRNFRKLRSTPVVLFGAYNPFLRYGLERFCADAAAAGANGLLLPDVPFEEAEEVRPIAREHALDLVYLVAPTTPPARQAEIAAASTGFVYYISLKGVTGARASVSANIAAPVNSLRGVSPVPVAVGFGISTAEQAAQVGALAEGVIVGSALINIVDQAEPAARAKAAGGFMATLKAALTGLAPLPEAKPAA